MKNKIVPQIKSGIYSKGSITLENIIQSIKSHYNIEDVGSILTFTGIVRKTSNNGKPVKGLKIDAYIEMANKSIEKICEEIKKKDGIIDVILVHFQGDFSLSENLVYVVVASSHRGEGFTALRETVEKYKKEIAVWKKEDFIDGTSEWVH